MGRFTITIVSKQAKITDQTHSKKGFLGCFNKFSNTPSLPHWQPLMATVLEGWWKGDCTVTAITVEHLALWGVRVLFQLWYIFKVTSSCVQSWHQTEGALLNHPISSVFTLLWSTEHDSRIKPQLELWLCGTPRLRRDSSSRNVFSKRNPKLWQE